MINLPEYLSKLRHEKYPLNLFQEYNSQNCRASTKNFLYTSVRIRFDERRSVKFRYIL